MLDETELQILPTLPLNARYEYHKNDCFDWCGPLLAVGPCVPCLLNQYCNM